MYKIVKRNGAIVDFNINKIIVAISKAFRSMNKDVQPDVLNMLAVRAVADAEHKVVCGTLSVENIQDSVEKILSEAGYFDVAKAYILYRQQHANIRQAKNTL